MSKRNQESTALLIAHGADIEALDTYGMTPLHRPHSRARLLPRPALAGAAGSAAYLRSDLRIPTTSCYCRVSHPWIYCS